MFLGDSTGHWLVIWRERWIYWFELSDWLTGSISPATRRRTRNWILHSDTGACIECGEGGVLGAMERSPRSQVTSFTAGTNRERAVVYVLDAREDVPISGEFLHLSEMRGKASLDPAMHNDEFDQGLLGKERRGCLVFHLDWGTSSSLPT